MQVFDFTGGREITPPPAKSGNQRRLTELIGIASSRIFELLRTYPLKIRHGAPPRTGPASARAAPLAARATSMPPSRSAVKARKMRDAREEARGTTPACGTYDDMRYVSCGFVRVSSKCHLVQSDVIMALLSFVLLRCGIDNCFDDIGSLLEF